MQSISNAPVLPTSMSGAGVDPRLQRASATGQATPFEDHSEWEYELDDEETEDFYFLLDLTTHVPDALVAKNTTKTRVRPTDDDKDQYGESINGTPARTSQPSGQNGGPVQSVRATSRQNENELLDDGKDEDEAKEDDGQPKVAGELQILGLDTIEPYVTFDNAFYSCFWLTDIGTEVWVSPPGLSDDPVFSGNILDVVATSRARLVACPATISRRVESEEDDDYDSEEAESNAVPPWDLDPMFASGGQGHMSSGPLVIPKERIEDPFLQSQASFLERLSAIKHSKGETDNIPLQTPKYYDPPANAHQIRARRLEEEEERAAAEAERIRQSGRLSKADEEYKARLISTPWAKKGQMKPRKGGIDSKNSKKRAFSELVQVAERNESPVPTEEGTPDAEAGSPKVAVRKGGRKKSSQVRAELGLDASAAERPEPPLKRPRRTRAELAALAEASVRADMAKKGQTPSTVTAVERTQTQTQAQTQTQNQPQPAKRKVGRPSNAERAAKAAAEAEAQGQAPVPPIPTPAQAQAVAEQPSKRKVGRPSNAERAAAAEAAEAAKHAAAGVEAGEAEPLVETPGMGMMVEGGAAEETNSEETGVVQPTTTASTARPSYILPNQTPSYSQWRLKEPGQGGSGDSSGS